MEGKHDGIITKEDFLKAQEIFYEIDETKNIIPKTYPLYRKAAETMKDDSLSQAFSVMKKYSGADALTQAMVQELIEKVVITDPEHVEIVWKFKDEVRNFIGI